MNEINVGDKVEVWFDGSAQCQEYDGEVLYMPGGAMGDCWIIKDSSGAIHYLQTFAEIVKRPS